MENVFSKKRVTAGVRMYSIRDNTQRMYAGDNKYFCSLYNIRVLKDKYTITSAYSWALLDMYGETLSSGYCHGTTEVTISDKRVYYITVSGLLSNLDSVMILDAPISETGNNPPYIPNEDDEGSGTVVVSDNITSLLANNFVYNESSNTYTVSDTSPEVDDYSKVGKEFTMYVSNIDFLKAGSSIRFLDHSFRIYHITNEPLNTTMESVASMMPFLCSKTTMTAKMLYSYVSTSQEGLGLEDVFVDVGDEPFKGE